MMKSRNPGHTQADRPKTTNQSCCPKTPRCKKQKDTIRKAKEVRTRSSRGTRSKRAEYLRSSTETPGADQET